MPQRILGIDLGSWSVKAVLIESGYRGFKVEAADEVVLPPGEPETRAERQAAAVKQLLESGALRADVSVAALPGEQAALRFVPLPFSDPKKIEATIAGELADLLPFELDEAVFDHTLVSKRGDGSSLSLSVSAPKTKVESMLATLKSAGADPRFLGVDMLQLFNLYSYFLQTDASRTELPPQSSAEVTAIIPAAEVLPEARLIVDIGNERTLLCAASAEGIAYARVLRAGGRDITDAIARAYALPWADAEAVKHEDAWLASSRHPAPTDQAQQMSEVVAQGLVPVLRELRRSLQAIRTEKKVRVTRVEIVGGSARIKNLAPYLADQLNLPVACAAAVEQNLERALEPPRRPAFALALAYCLRALGEAPVSRLDLRVGNFAFAGQLQNLRQRIPAILGGAALLCVLLAIHTGVRYHLIRQREAAVDAQFCKITQEVVGREICEPAMAVSVLREPAGEFGSFKLPKSSGFQTAAELSGLVPPDIDVTVGELDINAERARVTGTTASFDAVDKLVSAYQSNRCYSEINKGNIRKKSDGAGVEFQVSVRLGCSQ